MTEDDKALAAVRVRALDLEPVVFALMHPDSGRAPLSLPEADADVAMYRSYLMLCAWYPGELLVPSRDIDRAWQAHILDTAKYARDCIFAFGYVLHHFPYQGMLGSHDARMWAEGYARTLSLLSGHGGSGGTRQVAARAGNGRICLSPCGSCPPGNCECDFTDAAEQPRPRPGRTPAA
ncbi:MAG TPA: hypothetical protein VGL63_02665 [Streptosporangiaceae bacterium]